jgi:deazaflavin-dependent oxidoreductase (nitroreductase family)
MSFTTRPGTHGARKPGRAMRLVNKLVVRWVRRTGGKLRGSDVLLLTTVGRKSGVERTTPVNWFPGENGSWLIVASAAGAAQNPAWYYNLAAHPDQLHIEVAGRRIPVTAQQLRGAEREAAWRRITTTQPQFAGYEHKTDRELPVIRLVSREAAAESP